MVTHRHRRPNAFAVAVLIVSAVGTVHRAAAQSTDSAAEQAFRLGYRALKAGDCGEALVHYRRSLELERRPRTLFNIATCEEDLGQAAAAYTDYLAFLEIAEARDASIAVEARARLDDLRKRLRGRVSVESSPAGASVSVDNERQARVRPPRP